MPVLKKDGSLCICGDFKLTINPALRVDQYPLPNTLELLASLAGGKRFTKLDLTSAYQQMHLVEEPLPLTTINMHKGLSRYTRMPFGVALASAIFQRVIDTSLHGLPSVICYLDNTLVTGDSDANHLANLQSVLKSLKDHGIRLKQKKCKFFQDSVEYLGHTLSKEGVHTSTEKVRAIADQPVPKSFVPS